jgi:uncharacterized protein (UPF0332 family)
MLGIGLNEDAGRTAYLAGLHAAQAFIFESTGRVFRKHSGVQREFARLVKSEPSIDPELRAFLPRTYNLKAIADYETGPGSTISAESARAAVQTARRFVKHIIDLIPRRATCRGSRTSRNLDPARAPLTGERLPDVDFPRLGHCQS